MWLTFPAPLSSSLRSSTAPPLPTSLDDDMDEVREEVRRWAAEGGEAEEDKANWEAGDSPSPPPELSSLCDFWDLGLTMAATLFSAPLAKLLRLFV